MSLLKHKKSGKHDSITNRFNTSNNKYSETETEVPKKLHIVDPNPYLDAINRETTHKRR